MQTSKSRPRFHLVRLQHRKWIAFGSCLVAVISLNHLRGQTTPESPKPTRHVLLSLSSDQVSALELGQQIKAIQRAIERPEIEGSLKAVTQLGHDQRYYVLVRGWLAYQLQADESIAAATPETSPKIKQRIEFLKRAIRAVDLE